MGISECLRSLAKSRPVEIDLSVATWLNAGADEIDKLRTIIRDDVLPITQQFKTLDGKRLHLKLCSLFDT